MATEKLYKYPNAVVRVTIPDRSPEQQDAFDKRLRKATERFFRDAIANGCDFDRINEKE